MEVKIKITDKYLNDPHPILFELEKENGDTIDEYNELLYSKGKLRLKNIPTFIKQVLDEGFDYNGSGFAFGPITEGDHIWVSSDMVEFYVDDYKILYSKLTVLKFALQLANKSMEAVVLLDLKNRGFVDDAWVLAIKEAIPQLEVKLKNTP